MKHELSDAKTDKQKNDINRTYRPTTIRDLKKCRGKWDDVGVGLDSSKEIHLLTDALVDPCMAG